MAWHERQFKRRRQRGFDVENFCTTIPYLKGRWLHFPELDQRWKAGDLALMQMYEDLAERLEDRDVLILYNGANLHPEFVKWLKMMKVYTAGDPESEDILAKPLAPSFDLHLVNHVPSVETYQSWGLKHVYFWPLGSQTIEEEVDDLSEEVIRDTSRRPLPIVLFCERSSYRKERLDKLTQAFPEALCAGRGWPRGFVDWPEMWFAYRQAQIGWNVHNSTGFNFRTYELAAYGVMQICDNKSDLPQIYELGKEVVGFDSIEECIQLTHYYLAHPGEQREIALAAWKHWKRDYTPDRVWDRLVDVVEAYWPSFSKSPPPDASIIRLKLRMHSQRSCFYRLVQRIKHVRQRIARRLTRILSNS